MKITRRTFVATVLYPDGSEEEVIVSGAGTMMRSIRDVEHWTWQQGKPGRCKSMCQMSEKQIREEKLA